MAVTGRHSGNNPVTAGVSSFVVTVYAIPTISSCRPAFHCPAHFIVVTMVIMTQDSGYLSMITPMNSTHGSATLKPNVTKLCSVLFTLTLFSVHVYLSCRPIAYIITVSNTYMGSSRTTCVAVPPPKISAPFGSSVRLDWSVLCTN